MSSVWLANRGQGLFLRVSSGQRYPDMVSICVNAQLQEASAPSVLANNATLRYRSAKEDVAEFPAYGKTVQAMVESSTAPRILQPNTTKSFQPTSHVPIISSNVRQVKRNSSPALLSSTPAEYQQTFFQPASHL